MTTETLTGQSTTLCAKCYKREGKLLWTGEGGILALSHGFTQKWCAICALEAQLDHARERAAAIPGLEAQLRDAIREDIQDVSGRSS